LNFFLLFPKFFLKGKNNAVFVQMNFAEVACLDGFTVTLLYLDDALVGLLQALVQAFRRVHTWSILIAEHVATSEQ
jgi:hypothetical protein